MFLCHQDDGRICAGWAGIHDMAQNLAIRVAIVSGDLSPEDAEAVLSYAERRDRSVELFRTGQEAADHGKAEMTYPSARASRIIDRLVAKRALEDLRDHPQQQAER